MCVEQWHPNYMSMAELMRTVVSLPAEQETELAAFLLHLRLQPDPAWPTEMSRRIDDTNPESSVALEDWKKELVNGEEE